MITSRTKRQLIVFVILTVVGVAFVGARYAKLGRAFHDGRMSVTAQYTDSGGIFKGAEVTYRGVNVGEVTDLRLTRAGVDVVMKVDDSAGRIPADTKAVVGNKSAVGEQYVDLQPRTDSGPYLKDGSVIKKGDTEIPVSTVQVLTSVDNLVNSVPQGDLRTVVGDLGAAFTGTGTAIGQIIDASNAFLRTADQNFAVTAALIRDSDTVLQTQVDKTSAIKSFSRDLALFSGTLAGSDADLRKVIDNGSATADQLRIFLQKNQVNLGQLISKLVTSGQVVVKHLNGVRQILVLYPYIVEGAYSVLAPAGGGNFNANFGLVLTNSGICGNQSTSKGSDGYQGTDRRGPGATGQKDQLEDRPMNTKASCTADDVTFRGNMHSPANRVGTDYRSAPVATYDAKSGKVTWTGSDSATTPDITYTGGARDSFGKDSWKWLLLQPVSSEE